MRVDLGTVQMNLDTPDANGTMWYCTGLDGWEAPALRQNVVEPTGRHGGYISEGLLGPRSVVVRGVAKCTSDANFWTSYNGLLGLMNSGTAAELLKVHEVPNVKRMRVQRGGAPRIEFVGQRTFVFEYPLIAMDPLKYNNVESTQTFSATGQITVTNIGNFETLPTITVGTVPSGYTQMRAENLTVTSLLGDNAWVIVTNPLTGMEIDFAKRTVRSGGSDYYQRLSQVSSWWALQPGANVIERTGTTPWTLTWRDAWV